MTTVSFKSRAARLGGSVLALSLVSAGGALSQTTDPATAQAVSALPEVVVTATRVPTPLEQTGLSVTVITAEEIARRQHRTLVDVLRAVPGVSTVQFGPPGAATSVYIRGGNPDHTLVLLDGVRANDPSTSGGQFNVAHLLADMIERVEIVRGPMSTQYGSDAIGGVINVITRKGSGAPKLSASLEGGSFGTVAASSTLQGESGRFNYNVGVAGLRTDGVSTTPSRFRPAGVKAERDPYRNLTFMSRLGAEVTDNFGVSLFARYINTRSQYDQFSAEDPNLRELTEQWYGRLQGDLSLLDGKWKQTFGLSLVDVDRKDKDDPDAFSPAFDRTRNIGRRYKLDWQNEFALADNLTLVAGVESERSGLHSTNATADIKSHVWSHGLFAQGQIGFWDSLFLTVGGRVDKHSEFGTHPTFRASLSYVVHETGTTLHGAVGTAYKAPSLFQLFGSIPPFFTGNPDLKPEKSLGWEAGVEQSLFDGRLRLGTTFFHNRFRDLISSDPSFTTVINIGRARAFGLESFVELRPAEWASLRFDHTWTDTKDLTTGEQLTRRPRHKFGIEGEVRPAEAWSVGLGILFNGERKDFDPITFSTGTAPSYTLVRLTTQYQINENWQVFGRIENLFDKRYEDPLGYAHPGIGGYAGLRVTF